jgi:hypothetical protein
LTHGSHRLPSFAEFWREGMRRKRRRIKRVDWCHDSLHCHVSANEEAWFIPIRPLVICVGRRSARGRRLHWLPAFSLRFQSFLGATTGKKKHVENSSPYSTCMAKVGLEVSVRCMLWQTSSARAAASGRRGRDARRVVRDACLTVSVLHLLAENIVLLGKLKAFFQTPHLQHQRSSDIPSTAASSSARHSRTRRRRKVCVEGNKGLMWQSV